MSRLIRYNRVLLWRAEARNEFTFMPRWMLYDGFVCRGTKHTVLWYRGLTLAADLS